MYSHKSAHSTRARIKQKTMKKQTARTTEYWRRNGKRGYTLVELSVVLLLIAILTGMIASFSALANQHAQDVRKEYAFVEQCSTLRQELGDWIALNDQSGATITANDGTLTITVNGTSVTASLVEGVLHLGDGTIELGKLSSVSFSLTDGIIKCVASDGGSLQQAFAFAVRCGTVNVSTQTEGGNE